MRTKILFLLALTGLFAFGITVQTSTANLKPRATKSIVWQPDLRKAQQVAQQTGRPILVFFSADWCTHCDRFKENTLHNATMAEYINRDFVAVQLDFDKETKVAEILEVEALPSTVIISPEADLLGRVVGAKPPKELWDALQGAKDEQIRIRQARFAAGEASVRQ